ncbi:glycosyltransferase family 4 protein [Listeria grandensis]|uniref:Glycosyltransferase family 4 protein n=1 Tax=Listeria grandensis TaxID=1494963 RepID=A0A7X0Y3F0_9LIST|nr:glycosyltransferase family 4 protein [Listeria grandensis]MBC1473835.1 glycosyltransferase family 4 protein [Listeria grandensis]MBC1936148.1 glycosyltransferase family 4 protein [Listeria grandensis]
MKILYLHQYFATRNSYTSTRSYEFAKKLIEHGHEVTMLTTDTFLTGDTPYKEVKNMKYYHVDGIEVIAVKNDYSNYMGLVQRSKSFLSYMHHAYKIGKELKGMDIMFSTSTPLTIAIPTLRLQRKLKIPFVFEVRDLWPEAPKQMKAIKSQFVIKMLQHLEKRVYKKAEHIISLSPGMTEGIVATGIQAEKITMIPNLSDLALFDLEQDYKMEKRTLAERFSLKDAFIMLHLGAMGEANGLDYIVEAAKILQDRKQDEIKIIIGGDGKSKPRLEKFCAKHRLTNVIFSGHVSRKDVPIYTSLADITMTCFKPLPILATNSPNKFFDSLAAGRPIIVNSDGWTKDIVQKYDIGYYVDPAEPEELAEKLIELQNQRTELRAQQSKIRNIAEEHYSAEKLADKVEMILLRSLERSNLN